MSFSDNLQFLRNEAGLTQEQLAEQLDVSRQSVSKWEGGQSFPEMDTLLRLCDLYNTNLDTLLRGSVEESRVTDTAHYDHFMNVFAWRIALSVGAILLGIALMGVLDGLGVAEPLCGALLLLIITVAVVVMVASGIQYENFCKKHPVIADFYTEAERDAFRQKFVWLIAGGVGAILFAVTLLVLFEEAVEQPAYEDFFMAGFLAVIAAAVTSFIYGGIQFDKYNIAKYNRANSPTPEAKARLNLIGTICAVLMMLATAIYVGLGLAMNQWRTAWWIFAVAGILCGVVSVILDPYKGEE